MMQPMIHDPHLTVSDARRQADDAACGSAPGRAPYRPAAGLDPAARARIGRGLRLLYAEILSQPVPDDLAALVANLGTVQVPR